MKRVIEQIRGVAGVLGVIVKDSVTAEVAALLPSRFDEDNVAELEARLNTVIDHLPEDTACNARFKFDSGWLILRSHHDFMVMVLARTDINFETLNLVLKGSLASLRHMRKPDEVAHQAYDPNSPKIVIDAMNRVIEHLSRVSAVGANTLSGAIRKAKDELIDTFPMLKHFSVDNNGHISLIRGSEKHLDEGVVQVAAVWVLTMKARLSAVAPVIDFDILEITRDSEQDLKRLGFYRAFRRATSTGVR
jgi:hypothetical protein